MARHDLTAMAVTGALAFAAIACDLLSRVADKATADRAHAAYLQQEQLAHSEGIALTPGELEQPIPISENAAPIYAEAGKLLLALRANPVSVLSHPDKVADMRRLLERAHPGLELVDKAAALPDCQFRTTFDSQAAFDFPKFAEMKILAKYATCQADFEAKAGKPSEALDGLARRAPLCKHQAQSPHLIAVLVQIACQQIIEASISHILSEYGRQPGVAEAAGRALRAIGQQPDLVRITEGENMMMLDLLSPKNLALKPGEHGLPTELAPEDPESTAEATAMLLAGRPGMPDRWRACQIETTREVIAALRHAGPDQLELEQRLHAIAEATSATKDGAHAWARLVGSIDTMAEAVDAVARAQSMNRVLLQACAIFEIWNGSGRLPTALPLTGSAAYDPLANRDLHYSTTPKYFKIYGVGQHGVDHGGIPVTKTEPTIDGYDMVFQYPTP